MDRREALKKMAVGGVTIVGASSVLSSTAFADGGTPNCTADRSLTASGTVVLSAFTTGSARRARRLGARRTDHRHKGLAIGSVAVARQTVRVEHLGGRPRRSVASSPGTASQHGTSRSRFATSACSTAMERYLRRASDHPLGLPEQLTRCRRGLGVYGASPRTVTSSTDRPISPTARHLHCRELRRPGNPLPPV